MRHCQTVSACMVQNCLAEIHGRYGSGHLVSRIIRRATPLILEAVGQVSARTARTFCDMTTSPYGCTSRCTTA